MNLTELKALAQTLLDFDADVKEVESQLKVKKEKARVLRETTIPNVMDEMELSSITLNTGQKLTISQEVYAKIPADKKKEAHDWLNSNGFGGLIKTTVKATYGKGERKDAVTLTKELHKRGLDVAFDESVHASTLKAFLKEQIRDGNPCPLDIFGARPVSVAKIK